MRIRPAAVSDRDFVVGLVGRLFEFGTVPGRDLAALVARDRDVLGAAVEGRLPESAVFIGEDERGTPLGFIHLTTADDYYTARDTAHVGDVVVSPAAVGQGVGTALLAFAEEWARGRGSAMLTLNVFTANTRARELYRRLGFHEEWIRCVKHLRSGA